MNPDTELKTERDCTEACVVAGSELANKWLQRLGKEEADIRAMLASGLGLELVLTLHPVTSIDMRLIEADSARVRLVATVINSSNAH